MKLKITLALGFLLISLGLYPQNFPGNDVELLVDKKIKVLPKEESLQKYGYKGFFKDSNLKRKYACCQNNNSKYKKLENKVFNVLSYKSYTNSSGTERIKLQIENEKTGIIYFDYNPEYEHSFPFEVIGGLSFPDGFFCKDIEETKDKFTGKTRYQSPISEPIVFIKVKDNEKINTLMRIRVIGRTINVEKTGAIILLNNGEKIEKPNVKIDTDVNKHRKGFEYSTIIYLSEDDIEKLKENIITDVRLYIYDKTIKNGEKLREYLKCISKK